MVTDPLSIMRLEGRGTRGSRRRPRRVRSTGARPGCAAGRCRCSGSRSAVAGRPATPSGPRWKSAPSISTPRARSRHRPSTYFVPARDDWCVQLGSGRRLRAAARAGTRCRVRAAGSAAKPARSDATRGCSSPAARRDGRRPIATPRPSACVQSGRSNAASGRRDRSRAARAECRRSPAPRCRGSRATLDRRIAGGRRDHASLSGTVASRNCRWSTTRSVGGGVDRWDDDDTAEWCPRPRAATAEAWLTAAPGPAYSNAPARFHWYASASRWCGRPRPATAPATSRRGSVAAPCGRRGRTRPGPRPSRGRLARVRRSDATRSTAAGDSA